jgi:anti-anti-sigma factor
MPSGHSGSLSWTIERASSRSAVSFVGEIDLAVIAPLWSALESSLRMDDLVTLNLRGVSFIDSMGLRLLLGLKRDIEAAGGDLVLTSVSAPVKRVLEITGTASYFSAPSSPAVQPISDVVSAVV